MGSCDNITLEEFLEYIRNGDEIDFHLDNVWYSIGGHYGTTYILNNDTDEYVFTSYSDDTDDYLKHLRSSRVKLAEEGRINGETFPEMFPRIKIDNIM